MGSLAWTNEDIEQLKTLTVAGRSASQIAAIMDTSKNTIIGKWNRLDLNPPKKDFWTKPRVAELQRLSAKGLSAAEIANQMGSTRLAVLSKQRRLNIRAQGGRLRRKERIANGLPARTKPNVTDFNPSNFRRRGQSIPPTTIQPTNVPIDPLYVGLIDLESYQCHWPLDHKGQDGLETFCGHTKFGEYSYCYAHCCVGYQKFACGPGEVLEAAE